MFDCELRYVPQKLDQKPVIPPMKKCDQTTKIFRYNKLRYGSRDDPVRRRGGNIWSVQVNRSQLLTNYVPYQLVPLFLSGFYSSQSRCRMVVG